MVYLDPRLSEPRNLISIDHPLSSLSALIIYLSLNRNSREKHIQGTKPKFIQLPNVRPCTRHVAIKKKKKLAKCQDDRFIRDPAASQFQARAKSAPRNRIFLSARSLNRTGHGLLHRNRIRGYRCRVFSAGKGHIIAAAPAGKRVTIVARAFPCN